jgi:uncharacterized protein (TIGR02466 family)
MENKKIIPLFPTPLYVSQINLLKDEIDFIKNTHYLRLRDSSGFMSKNNNILKKNNLKNLKKQIIEHLKFYKEEVFSISNNINVFIKHAWLMKHIKGDKSHKHFHQNSLISGIVYVKTPKKSGNIIFHKKNSIINDISPLINLNFNEFNLFNSGAWNLDIEENMIVLFPSYLDHSTEANESDDERYCLSFDTFLKGKIKTHDKELEIK